MVDFRPAMPAEIETPDPETWDAPDSLTDDDCALTTGASRRTSRSRPEEDFE